MPASTTFIAVFSVKDRSGKVRHFGQVQLNKRDLAHFPDLPRDLSTDSHESEEDAAHAVDK
jgi:hypothetical protein